MTALGRRAGADSLPEHKGLPKIQGRGKAAFWRLLIVAAACLLAAGSGAGAQRILTPYPFLASPNFGERPPGAVVNCVVVHATVIPTLEGTAAHFLDPKTEVSAHFVVGRDGRVVQMVALEKRAWHAGVSRWMGEGNLNNTSVGIEMVNLNDGLDPYPAEQIQAVAGIIRFLRGFYVIPDVRIVSHADIAVPFGRKSDPLGFDFGLLKKLARLPSGALPPLPAAAQSGDTLPPLSGLPAEAKFPMGLEGVETFPAETLLPFAFQPSPNFNDRPPGTRIEQVVIHATAAGTTSSTVTWFLMEESQVSAHFVVGKDGRVVQMVPLEKRAWHAGPSAWGWATNLNHSSIGIEMVNLNNGKDPYPEAQMQATAALVRFLRGRFAIEERNVVTHEQVALPLGRKDDPQGFDLARLRLLSRPD